MYRYEFRRTFVDTLKEMVSDHVHSWKKIGRLAITHLIKEYRGAVFGWAWAVIKPAVVIFVFWFAFTFGLRKGDDINGYSFFLWLISGFVPWFFMRDAMASGSSSIRKYRYLVQKINFPIDTIPTFVCLGELIVNIFLFILMNLIFFIFGHGPDIYYLQIPLYYAMMFIFFDLFSIFLALIGSVSLDFLNLTRAMIPAIFWLSGIIYDVYNVQHEWLRNLLLLSPVTILVNGFRNAMIYHRWFWEFPAEMLNFWIVTGLMLILTVHTYRKLRSEIPDIL